MSTSQKSPKSVKVSPEHEKAGFRAEPLGEYVQVWHWNNQIALLVNSPDIERKVHDVIERRRQELDAVEKATGWKPSPPASS